MAEFVMNAGDRAIVKRDLGAFSLGRYQVAANLGSFAMFFLVLLTKAWLPRILEVADDVLRWSVVNTARDHIYEMLVPLSIAFALGAPLALDVWAPQSYGRGSLVLVMVLISVTAFPYARAYGSWQALLSLGKTRALAVTTLAAAALNLALNLALVPRFQLVGSAISTVTSFSALSVANVYLARRANAYARPSFRLQSLVFGSVGVDIAIAVAVPVCPYWLAIRTAAALGLGVWFLAKLRSVLRPGTDHYAGKHFLARRKDVDVVGGPDTR
jgi:O-antigen/teichoic acid export membrane protein